MNYENLLKNLNIDKAKIALIGANGGFGYTFLNQIICMDKYLVPRVVCDIDINKSVSILKELGFNENLLYPCRSISDIQAAPKEVTIILDDCNLVPFTDADIVVEATGLPEGSSKNAEDALLHGKHVCMVSKEADCISGPYLYNLAKSKNLVYTIIIGDQPGNLINFLSWIKTLGIEVVCAGKSSEYDFIYDREQKTLSFKDKKQLLPDFDEYWDYKSPDTLSMRSKILDRYPKSSEGDYCEMNVIANATGLIPSCDKMHYPVCNPSELVKIYIPKEEGGILEKTGVLDVFNDMVRPDEVSFAGGVYAIVKCNNEKVWQLLAEKRHIVSEDRKYACMYLPYHFMGVEAPMSLILTHYLKQSTYTDYKENARMVCTTTRDFKAGEKFIMIYERRHIADTAVSLVQTKNLPHNIVPYYMVAEKTLLKDVPAGTIITEDMIDLSNSVLKRMRDSMRDEEN